MKAYNVTYRSLGGNTKTPVFGTYTQQVFADSPADAAQKVAYIVEGMIRRSRNYVPNTIPPFQTISVTEFNACNTGITNPIANTNFVGTPPNGQQSIYLSVPPAEAFKPVVTP